MASKLIPNTFQYPNWYADELDHFLTAQEQVVLKKAVREILGWHSRIESRQARIALSVFVDGKFSRDTGERLAWGCGLSKGAVRKALNGLDQFGILVKCGDATQDGQLFKLEDDSDKVDIAGLQARYEQRIKKNRDKTEIGRGVLSDNRGIVEQHGGGIVGQDEGGTVEQPERNPRKPKETKHVASATLAPAAICYHCEENEVVSDGMCADCLAKWAESHDAHGDGSTDTEQKPPPYHCKHCGDLAKVDTGDNPDTQGQYFCMTRCGVDYFINEQPITRDCVAMMQYLGWNDELERLGFCSDCGKHKHTTEEMPHLAETCTCHARELEAAFGNPKPPPPIEVTPTPHWTEQARQPWASWGAESDEFQRQLQRFGDSGRIVQELGYKLERATNLRPLWDSKKKVKWWSSGLWELYREAGCNIDVAIEAAKALKESKMTVTSPYSVANMARALAAEKSQKPKRLVIK